MVRECCGLTLGGASSVVVDFPGDASSENDSPSIHVEVLGTNFSIVTMSCNVCAKKKK
jgi:hypothetical protein